MKKKIICYVYMYTYNNNDMSFRLSLIAKVQKKIENFILFPLLKATTTKISQCLSASVCILFSYLLLKSFFTRRKEERDRRNIFFTRLTFAFAFLLIYSCLFDILNSKKDLCCRFFSFLYSSMNTEH